jgi:hypothetical protein
MTNYLGLAGSLIASVVALTIAIVGWRKSDRRAQEEKQSAARKEQAAQLRKLLELSLDAAETRHLSKHDAKMKAILLTLPGHFATVLRNRLRLEYTMKDVALDPASAARLRADEQDAGHKWLIFDRSSGLSRTEACGPTRSGSRPSWPMTSPAYSAVTKMPSSPR